MDSAKIILIHDLTPSLLSCLLPEASRYTVIDANHKAAFCQGCFGCWLKSPGQCVIKDHLQTVSTEIGCSQQVIIFSRCCYGGFSPAVKRVLDRSIAVSLPFFTYRGGRVHHSLRYQNHPKLTVCFYGPATEFERQTAAQVTHANGVNMGFSAVRVSFAENPEQLAEVITL